MLLTPLSIKCPNCRRKFVTHEAVSVSVFAVYTDFRRDFSAPWVHTCTHCGFAGSRDRFRRKVSPALTKLVASHLKPLKPRSESIGWRKFAHAARIAEWEHRPAEEIANLYIGAAHECAGNSKSSRRVEAAYRKKAIKFFRKSLAANEIAEKDVPSVTYLVGELYRRIGETADAEAWLAKAEALVGSSDELAWLAMLARQQRTNPEDEIADRIWELRRGSSKDD